jgi:hypothetical protein
MFEVKISTINIKPDELWEKIEQLVQEEQEKGEVFLADAWQGLHFADTQFPFNRESSDEPGRRGRLCFRLTNETGSDDAALSYARLTGFLMKHFAEFINLINFERY